MIKMPVIMGIYKTISDFLSSAKLLHYSLPVLMVYLVLGTVAQKYIGLYEASKIFFSSPVIWIYDVVPLPGMPAIIAVIFFNISFKLIFKSPWTIKNSGIIITHIGAMLLMQGGLLTALFSHEGYLDIIEGQSKSAVADYHAREFVIIDEESGDAVQRLDHAELHAGYKIDGAGFPFTIGVLEYCQNCDISARENATELYQGMAQHMQIAPKALNKNNEENLSGLTLSVTDRNGLERAVFVVLEEVPQHPRFQVGDASYRFELRRTRRNLPFDVELVDFEKELYPGTNTAKSYSSLVRIRDNGAEWESLISMNAPLRYKGYTFFQSSFAQTPNGEEVSVLAVVWNAGRSFPYISGLVMCIGLLLHLFVRQRKPDKKVAALLPFVTFLMLFSAPVKANSFQPDYQWDIQKLGQTPILHEGRMKPLDSFARAKMKRFSGQDDQAMEWLVTVIFDPARAENTPVMRVSDPEIRRLLNLEKRKHKLYSFQEILKGILPREEMIKKIVQTEDDLRTPQHRELLILHQKFLELQDLLSSLSLFIPLSLTIPEDAPASLSDYMGQPITIAHHQDLIHDLKNIVRNIIAEKGDDIENYSEAEKILAHLSYTLDVLNISQTHSTLLRVVPDKNDVMITPWRSHTQERGSDTVLNIWSELALAYHRGDKKAWSDHTLTLHDHYYAQTNAHNADQARLLVEYYYNNYNPFYFSFVLCLMAGLFLIANAFIQNPSLSKLCMAPVFTLLSASVLIQIIGICLRIYILDRPPISTLYETVIFVSALSMLYLIILAFRNPGHLWVWMCFILGILFHIVGFSHSQDSDSFVVLVAVLNTNFWLTTHVICITAGYGFCAITSILSHYAIGDMLVKKRRQPDFILFSHIRTVALISLFFATIGTVLGGIWADQSWGRFWGWDPKENGALLIVLWLIWALHGRISGQLHVFGFLCALSYLSVILALSWFGVNLLNVGLHSYGFTDSAAGILGAFITFESIFIVATGFLFYKRVRHA